MRAHLLQMNIEWEDRHKNFTKVQRLLDQAAPSQGDLIVLPELFDSGFSLNTGRTHDDNNDTLSFLSTLAKQTACTIQGSRTVREQGGLAHNRATILAPDGALICEYTKIHPFSFGREPEAFEGGTSLVDYDWDGLTVCPAICYDLRFPELFRRGTLAGAELFALGANWPSPRAHHWRTLSIARAIENQAFMLAVNRTGNDPHLPYTGGSLIVGPKGDILGELGDEEVVLTAEINADEVRSWRKAFPAQQDIRLID